MVNIGYLIDGIICNLIYGKKQIVSNEMTLTEPSRNTMYDGSTCRQYRTTYSTVELLRGTKRWNRTERGRNKVENKLHTPQLHANTTWEMATGNYDYTAVHFPNSNI